jgi:hypothetical protein
MRAGGLAVTLGFSFVLLACAGSQPPAYKDCGISCGGYRWPVKTLSDEGSSKVDFSPLDTTIDWLIGQVPPTNPRSDDRVSPIETHTYRVNAVLIGWHQETDNDFHIVIADPNNTQTTMIVEIPDPECSGACASGHMQDFQNARAAVVAKLGSPSSTFQRLAQPAPVTVVGVGFFDQYEKQTGVAPNAIELHPVLQITFN